MRIAVHQFAPQLGELEPNLAMVVDGVRAAAGGGAHLYVAPEMCLTGWTLRVSGERASLARLVASTVLPSLAALAAETGLAVIVGGPLPLSAPSGGDAFANAAIGLAADGTRAVYRKIHLFGEERAWWSPGDGPAILQVGATAVGLTICYDAEFPEVPRLTRLAGAQVIAVPTTNMSPYEPDQEVVFRARALENECVVVVANRVGSENDWRYFGRSLVVDPRGRIVARASGTETLLIADVELASGAADPELSYLARRRPEVYRPLVEPLAQPAGSGPVRAS